MNTNRGETNGTIVITGTSRGIGYHLACRFLTEGYGVIGISRTGTSIDHSRFRSIEADISDLSQVEGLSRKLSNTSIAGLINNAGIHGPIGPFEHAPLADWLQTFNTNLFGAAALSQICVPSIRKHNGFMIFFSGGGSAFPRPNFSAYGVSKCAVIRLSEVLAKELAPQVSVYCIAPGPNRTQLLDEAVIGGEVVPEQDIVDFEYVERLCLFLARNRDPRYSGKFIHVVDKYESWDDQQLAPDAHTLRRMDARTLSRLKIT